MSADTRVDPALLLDNTNLYYVYGVTVSVLGALLFLVLSPGFAFTLMGASKGERVSRTSCLVHACIFLVIFCCLNLAIAAGFKSLHQRSDEHDREWR
jgi:hypothetical protein